MKKDYLALLKACDVFASLDDASLQELLQQFKIVTLKRNKTLFKQGGFSTSLYFLVSGKLIVILKRDNSDTKALNMINPGETVGEMGALSNEPRTATVKAVEDSVLLKLSSEEFNALVQRHPELMQKTLASALHRSRSLIQLISNKAIARKQVAIVPASSNISLKFFSEKLISLNQTTLSSTIFSDFQSDIKSLDAVSFKKEIDQLRDKNQPILYIFESMKSQLAELALQQCDAIYVVAYHNSSAHVDPIILKHIKKMSVFIAIKIELILLYESDIIKPQQTTKWLDLIKFDLHHHLRIDQTKDWERILRFLCGKAFGLVLGGGGLRCWAHLGAIRALEKAGIPIDIVGGTSAGAIVAGHYAMYQTEKEPIKGLQELSEVTRKAIFLRNLTWPAASLFNSKNFTLKLFDLFGHDHIEDLWMPCFCITTNLSNFSQTIYRRGRLWKVIRSSASVPGIFPPVVIKGKLHTDGGILNNLPVDVMRKFIGPQGTVIAVELTHLNEDNTTYHFPPILTFWQTLLTKLRLIHHGYRFPHFVDTFLKSLLAGASAKQLENGLIADLLISPDLSKFGILNVKKSQEPVLIRMGYEAGVRAINAWHKEKD